MTSCFSWTRPVLPGALIALAVALAGASPAAAQLCVGDCNGDDRVSIAEVQACVNLAAGLGAPPCAAADQNGDGTVDSIEVDACVLSFLNAATCPHVAPTPTSPPATATHTPPPAATATNTPPPAATATNTPVAPTATHTPGIPTATFTATPGMEIGSHECVVGTGSSLAITTQALPLNLPASGSVQIDCGSEGPDGTAPCTCSVNSFAPVVIPAIGDVCVNPFAGCAAGVVDCDGGTAMDVDVKGDHDIGMCGNQAACEAACEAHCSTLGSAYAAISSSCEGFCQGGTNEDAACTNDNQCTGGTCPGQNPPSHPGVCSCVCGGTGLGAPAPAGSLSCNVGVQIDVELPSNGQCGDTVTILLPPQCSGVTTTQATGNIIDANKTMGKNLTAYAAPATGAGTTCASLASGTLAGLKLVGSLAFFDSTLGDIHSGNAFVCQ